MYYPELHFGGPPETIHDIGRSLTARGHEVAVVTLNSAKFSDHHSEVIDGIGLHYLPWIGKGSTQIHGGFAKLYQLVRWADMVDCYGLYNLICPIAAYFARLLGRNYVIEPEGMYIPRLRNVFAKQVYHQVFTSMMVRDASAVIATSPKEARELAALVEPERLVVRRNGLHIERFQNLPDRTEFRERFQIPLNASLIMYIGRISPVKNLENLILAFKEAALENTRMVLIGPTGDSDLPYAAKLQSLISEAGLAEKISLLGPLYGEDKLAALASADLFVLPSISESYGNSAAEAVAAGIPVLLTEGCGIAPLIDRRAGLTVQTSIESLAYGLRLLMTDPAARRELTQAQDEVIQELSWDEPILQIEVLFSKLAAQKMRK